MFKHLYPVEENLWRYPGNIDLTVARLYGQDHGLLFTGKEELLLELPSTMLMLNNSSVLVKVVGEVSEEVRTQIDELVHFLREVTTPLVFALTKTELNNHEFFRILPEAYLLHEKLAPALPELTARGLDFDQSLVEEVGSYFAIDCVDYIKFIPLSQFSKEKQVRQIVEELSSQTNHEPVQDWLDVIYRRHLLKHAFDSNGIHHILDWMNSLTDFSVLKNKLSYERALAKADQWVVMENQKMGITTTRDQEGVDVATVLSVEGYDCLHLLSENAKKREGAKMHNCIGRMHLKNPDLYSIRLRGRRVASLCVREQRIVEAKGPWNKGVEAVHRAGVRACLKQMKIQWGRSADLHNLGVKVFQLYFGDLQESLVVAEGEPFYDHPHTQVHFDKLFEGSLQSQVPEICRQLLSRFPESTRPQLDEKLREIAATFKPCPLTGFLFHQTHEFHRRSEALAKILQTYPELVDPFKNLVLKTKAASETLYGLATILSTAQDLASHQHRLPGPKEKVRAFLKELQTLGTNLFPGLYASIFGPVDSIQEVYGTLAKDTGLEGVFDELEEISKFIKASPPTLEVDDYSPEAPPECENCNNYSIWQQQMEVAEEIVVKKAEAKAQEEQMAEAWEVLDNFFRLVEKKFNLIHKGWLYGKEFDVIAGEVRASTLAEAKSLREDSLSSVEAVAEILKSYSGEKVRVGVAQVSEAQENLVKLEKELAKLSSSLEHSSFMGEGCSKCKDCGGDGEDSEGETCSTCGGHPQECGGEAIVDKNREGPRVHFDDAAFSSWSKFYVDLDAFERVLRALERVEGDPRGYCQEVFERMKALRT